MPKLISYEIEFDNPDGVYYAGTTLTGSIRIMLSEPMEIRTVRAVFNGKAYVEIGDGDEAGGCADEKYFEQEITVFGNEKQSDAPPTVMPGGTHTFSFTFPIPANCPSTFENGKYGYIRYTVSSKIDRPWKHDYKTKRAFTVLSIVDLNQIPQALEQHTETKEETPGCLCFKSGTINCQVNIPKKGYVAGQVVSVNAEVTNNSSKRVDKILIRLVRKVIFKTSGIERITHDTLAETVKDAVAPGSTGVWSNEGLKVPATTISTVNNCNIINIQYLVAFIVMSKGAVFGIVLHLPIFIGSVPLQRDIPQFQQMYNHCKLSSGVSAQPIAPIMARMYPDFSPPSYAEINRRVSIRDKTDDEDTMGQLEYAPRYPIFD